MPGCLCRARVPVQYAGRGRADGDYRCHPHRSPTTTQVKPRRQTDKYDTTKVTQAN